MYNFNTIKDYNEHLVRLKNDEIYKNDYIIWKKNKEIELWKNKTGTFINSYDVPDLPIPLLDIHINKLIELGAIRKLDLIDNQWYYGNYRRANLGKWNNKKQKFDVIRYSFNYYWDDCNHFEDDNGYALFVPIRKATLDEIKEVNNKLI